MKNLDQVLWERELAEHMSRHPGLQHLPPPVFPRRSSVDYLLVLIVVVFVAVPLGAIAGWVIGWSLI
ncbi:MAG: hypothetical protein ACRDSZ_25095 [Pseudonocardiaceae bacterium]